MLNYQELLRQEAKERKWNKTETNIFDAWRQSVGQMESKNNPSAIQRSKNGAGPGRGKYQYELTAEKNLGDPRKQGAALTAANRLRTYLEKRGYSMADLPEKDKKELYGSKNPDFSKLSENTQDILFLADKAEAPDALLNKLVKGEVSFDEAWTDWHWKSHKSSDLTADEQKARKQKGLKDWNDRIGIQTFADVTLNEPSWLKPLQTEQGQRPSYGLPMGPSEGGAASLLANLLKEREQNKRREELNNWQEPGAFKMPSDVYKEQQQLSDITAGVGDTSVPNVRSPFLPEPIPFERPAKPTPQYALREPPRFNYNMQPQRAPEPQYDTMEELLADLSNPLLRR